MWIRGPEREKGKGLEAGENRKRREQEERGTRAEEMNKRAEGSIHEAEAASYLEKNGYQILEHNYRCRQGEIDLIARDGRYLVFVEVKYRKDLGSGYPEEAVDRKKQQRIWQAARYYLYRHRYGEDTPCRFDVVSIIGTAGGTGEEIRVIRDAFS